MARLGDTGGHSSHKVRVCVCGVGRGQSAQVTDALAAAIAHRREREEQIRRLLRAQPQTPATLVESIYHGLATALVPAALDTVRAHLEKLRREGDASEEDGRWEPRVP